MSVVNTLLKCCLYCTHCNPWCKR